MRLGLGILACALLLATNGGAAASKPSVELGRVVIDLKPGDDWGAASSGMDCRKRTALTWKSGQLDIAGRDYMAAFKAEATSAGYSQSKENLFEEAGPSEFIVAGRVKYIRVQVCRRDEFGETRYSGEATLDMVWEVYSREERKVVGTVVGGGEARVSNGGSDILNQVVLAAFTESTHALLRKASFRTAIMPEAEVAESASPQPPATPITLRGSLSAPKRPIPQAVQSTVAIFTSSALGSGFLVSSEGYVLTNQHVVGREKTVKLRWPDGHETVGEVVRTDKGTDVALIKTPVGLAKPLPLRLSIPAQGETVYAIGTPLYAELQGTLTRGIVSATRIEKGHLLIQSDVSITHGNSGGPLLDEHGVVVGMSQSVIEGSTAQLNFFIPIGEALTALSLKPAA
jgi:serine protease Do